MTSPSLSKRCSSCCFPTCRVVCDAKAEGGGARSSQVGCPTKVVGRRLRHWRGLLNRNILQAQLFYPTRMYYHCTSPSRRSM